MDHDSQDASGAPGTPSRYHRVQAILDDAAGQSTATYQGYGRFWHLPLPELFEVSIYGVRMIAPPAAPAAAAMQNHCCDHGSAARQPGRGAASGLICGLRGLFPFDGTQFPPLPWGGTPVAPANIQFIEQWIDDGCPVGAADQSAASAAADLRRSAMASGQAEHPAHVGPVNQVLGANGALKQRKNILCLTGEELCRLRGAIAKMKSLDTYYQDERSFGYWARIHGNQCQHGWEEFLTWHRAYLYFFELQLQDIDPTVTLPYWDWTADAKNVKTSIEDHESLAPFDNGVIPEPYQADR